jgi:Resolvase, N terminal domain
LFSNTDMAMLEGCLNAQSSNLPAGQHPGSDHGESGELRAVAERTGIGDIKVYRNHGISGAKGRDKRPDFDRLCKDAARCQFDVIMARSVDRLGRSLQDLVGFLSEIHALKIDLYATPAGARHDDACWQGDVSDDGRIRRV